MPHLLTTGKDTPAPVLALVDFGEISAAVVQMAAKLSATAGAPLYLVHVIHDPAEAPGFYREAANGAGPMRTIEDVARGRGEALLASLRAQHPELTALVDAGFIMVRGLPATRLLEISEGVGAGLLVLGSATAGNATAGLGSWFQSSISRSLGKRAGVPVLRVHGDGSVSALHDTPATRQWVTMGAGQRYAEVGS